MYDHTLHRGRKHFCCFCLQAFRPEEILKVILKTALKLIVNKLIKCLRSGNILNSEPMEEKQSSFMIYADFESILGAEDNGKQNPNESNTSKYQKHVAGSYGNKLLCVEGKFSKPFKSYLTEDPVDNFINSTIDKSKYCSDVMKKHFKNRTITKQRKVLQFVKR